MKDLVIFQDYLKSDVLSKYKETYTFFLGNWEQVGNKEIANLIEDIEAVSRQRISEKWIYTHLKPKNNEKLPRKDMLDILSVYVGKKDWDHYKYDKIEIQQTHTNNIKSNDKRKYIKWLLFTLIGFVIIALSFYFFTKKNEKKSNKNVAIQNTYTKDTIPKEDITMYNITEKDTQKIQNIQEIENTDNKSKILIKSPFYKPKIVETKKVKTETIIEVTPNDNAMLLKNYLTNSKENWKNRKEKLQSILSDNVEVLVMMKGNLGAEYYNKEEFVQKISIPTESVHNMKIIDIQQNNDNKIHFIRIVQE